MCRVRSRVQAELFPIGAWRHALLLAEGFGKNFGIPDKSRVFTDTYSKDTIQVSNADKVIQGGTGYGPGENLPRQTISLIERGDYSPSVTLALTIAKVCGVTVEDVFYLQEEDEDGEK